MENGSATFAIVSGYHGTYNQDLDVDNDGQLDITPWASVISAVGWTENSNNTETIVKAIQKRLIILWSGHFNVRHHEHPHGIRPIPPQE